MLICKNTLYFQWTDSHSVLLADSRSVEHEGRSPSSLFHRHRPRLHLPLRRRVLRQRGNRDICAPLHVFPLDTISQDWLRDVGHGSCDLVLLHGVGLGRICLHHQPRPTTCVCSTANGSIL